MSIPPLPRKEQTISSPVTFADFVAGKFEVPVDSFDEVKIDKKALAQKIVAANVGARRSPSTVAGRSPVKNKIVAKEKGSRNTTAGGDGSKRNVSVAADPVERFPTFVNFSPMNDEDRVSESDVDPHYTEPDYVSPRTTLQVAQYTHQDSPATIASDENDEDVVSMTVEVSENGDDDTVPAIEQGFSGGHHEEETSTNSPKDFVKSTLRSPDSIVKRFTRRSILGRAPFTKSHIITDSRAPPFAGPHTAIQIPLGPDISKWLHFPKDMRAAEQNMAELAMYWLWMGLRREDGRSLEAESNTLDMAPSSPHQIAGFKTMGPPDAPYPFTTSTNSPFVGPRTLIRNLGKRLHGWILHIPRFLTKEEIVIASRNLRRTCSLPNAWAMRHDPDCTRGVKRTIPETTELIDALKKQDAMMVFLCEVIGLDFACQDEPRGGGTPIWVKRGSVWNDLETLAQLCASSTPAQSSPLAQLPGLVDSDISAQSSPPAQPPVLQGCDTPCPIRDVSAVHLPSTPGSVTVSNSPNQDIRKRIKDMRASLAAMTSNNEVLDANLQTLLPSDDGFEDVEEATPALPVDDLQPFPPSDDGSEDVEGATSASAGNILSTPDGQSFTGLPKQYVLFSRGPSGLVFKAELGDSSPVVDAAFLREVLVESPLHERTMEAAAVRDAAQNAPLGGSSPVAVDGAFLRDRNVVDSPLYHHTIGAAALRDAARNTTGPLPASREAVGVTGEGNDATTTTTTSVRNNYDSDPTSIPRAPSPPSLRVQALLFAVKHLAIALTGYILGGTVTGNSHALRCDIIVRPCEVVAYFDRYPERIIAVFVAIFGFGWMVVTPLVFLLTDIGAQRRLYLVFVLLWLAWAYKGAVDVAGNWRDFVPHY